MTYYQAHRTGLEIESAVDAVGVMLLVLFAATLHSQLKSAPSLMAFGAACILASCTLNEVAAFQSMAYRPTSDPALAALFSDFQGFAFEVTTFPGLAFLASIGVAIVVSRSVPRWVGLAAFLAAAAQAVAWISLFAPPGPLAAGGVPDIVSFVALLAWLTAGSGALIFRRPAKPG